MSNVYPAPTQFGYWNGLIRITVLWDDQLKWQDQPIGLIQLGIEAAIKPRLVATRLDVCNQPVGDPVTWDEDANTGRGMWVNFDPALHGVPVSQPLADEDVTSCEVDAVDEVEDEVELIVGDTPASDDPPFDDSFDLDDEDDLYDDDEDATG